MFLTINEGCIMDTNNFLKNKDVESYILNSAKYHAIELVKGGYFQFYELEDLEHEILARFYKKIKIYGFNEEKSNYKSWISFLIDKISIRLIEKAMTRNKYNSKISLNDSFTGTNNEDNNSSEIMDFIEDNNSNTFEEYYKSSQSKKLLETINSLPKDLKELCRLLKYKNATEVAKQLNISRATLYRKVQKIREIFIKANIDENWEL